jgi:hypothetical protein
MLYDNFSKKTKYWNIYVNVTQLLWKDHATSECLCLWNDNATSKCLCEYYMITSERKWNIKMFMWMLHDNFKKKEEISKCLCECYMITSERKCTTKMFMWMLHDNFKKKMKYQNVYVNVTW